MLLVTGTVLVGVGVDVEVTGRVLVGAGVVVGAAAGHTCHMLSHMSHGTVPGSIVRMHACINAGAGGTSTCRVVVVASLT